MLKFLIVSARFGGLFSFLVPAIAQRESNARRDVGSTPTLRAYKFRAEQNNSLIRLLTHSQIVLLRPTSKPMANEKNLKPNSKRTPSELREMTRKGGIASGKARRAKKTFKELLKIALEMSTKSGNTNAEEIVASMILKAQSGDVKAFEAIRDTIGEKPKDNVDLTTREEIPEGATALYAKIKAYFPFIDGSLAYSMQKNDLKSL